MLMTPDHAGNVVGVDPHKRTLTATVADARGGILASAHFRVSGEGHRELEAWASHDLRTPLTALQATLEAVEDGVVAPTHYLPAMRENIEALHRLVDGLSADGGNAAAEAIRTTDTVRKQTVVDVDGCRVAGMAKGAAMLAPNMATMLAVLTTNASVHPTVLRGTLAAAVNDSFNALSVDGCTSTNDTVLLLARGEGGDVSLAALRDSASKACADLATQMAADAEGATKVIRVRVKGARSAAEVSADFRHR